MVKDLIFVDPEDETPVKQFAEILGRKFEVVSEEEKLGDVLQTFKKGRGHLAIVRGIDEFEDGRDSTYSIRGIITLEDIVEAILGDEIVDETDQYIHMEKKDRVNRADFDYGRLDLLDSKLNENLLSPDEINAYAAHLCSNYPVFQQTPAGVPITLSEVKSLLSNVKYAITLKRESSEAEPPAKKDYIYNRNRPATKLTLVLSGKLSVAAGKDAFRSEAGPWTVLGNDAITSEEGLYMPDFSAFVATEQVRCVQISRAAYASHILKIGGVKKFGAASEKGSKLGITRVARHQNPRDLHNGRAAESLKNHNVNDDAEFASESSSGTGVTVDYKSPQFSVKETKKMTGSAYATKQETSI